MSFIKVEDVGIQQLSHSRMKTHEQCPRKAKYKFIDRLKEPENEAMARGLQVHQELERWLLAETTGSTEAPALPATGVYAAIRNRVKDLISKEYHLYPEQQVAFDIDWNLCNWFGPQVFMRVVYDFVAVGADHVVVCDYKTGKRYDDHELQAKLYALGAFKEHDVSEVEVVFFYLDLGEMQVYKYTSKDAWPLQVGVMERANRVRGDRMFPTKPSWLCRYCHFRKENGGPCAH